MGTIKIISHSDQPFADRLEAAHLLADELKDVYSDSSVVLGIPRGGVVIAHHMAKSLNCDMDVVLARKIGAPQNPELAIGAVAEDGKVFLHHDIVSYTGTSETYIKTETQYQLDLMNDRLTQYRRLLPKIPIEDRVVIITDDGIATGATMQAAIWAAKLEKASRIVAAVPVGPADSLTELAEHADEVICLHAPPYFYAIGQFYYDFDQVTDEQVMEILKQQAHKKVS
jgi:predicted phosphoribosyltransferase